GNGRKPGLEKVRTERKNQVGIADIKKGQAWLAKYGFGCLAQRGTRLKEARQAVTNGGRGADRLSQFRDQVKEVVGGRSHQEGNPFGVGKCTGNNLDRLLPGQV